MNLLQAHMKKIDILKKKESRILNKLALKIISHKASCSECLIKMNIDHILDLIDVEILYLEKKIKL